MQPCIGGTTCPCITCANREASSLRARLAEAEAAKDHAVSISSTLRADFVTVCIERDEAQARLATCTEHLGLANATIDDLRNAVLAERERLAEVEHERNRLATDADTLAADVARLTNVLSCYPYGCT